MTGSSNQKPAGANAWVERVGLLALIGLAVFFIATSWRKWCDPYIDFGRELYLPWRILGGALLYRDLDDDYGPLSPCLNAFLFWLFRPGLMVLVWANLAVFAGIAAVIYRLCRQAWGVGAALAAGAVFVSIFGFSQFLGIGNYNYATPHAHQATHGVLVCLLLALVLIRWVEKGSVGLSLSAGLLVGFTAVLKPEMLFGAGLLMIAAGIVRARHYARLDPRTVLTWAAGALIPTLAFSIYFACFEPWAAALKSAGHAWLNVASKLTVEQQFQNRVLGIDQPLRNLLSHAMATLLACGLVGIIAGVARFVDRQGPIGLRLASLLGAGGGLIWLAGFEIRWLEAGRCLMGLMVIYLAISAAAMRAAGSEEVRRVRLIRLLLSVLAVALMARMALNGRIYRYGYYQAALAGLMVPAILLGELPAWLRVGRWGRTAVVTGALSLLVPAVIILAHGSQQALRLKTFAIGDGRDRFYSFPPEIEPIGAIVGKLNEELQKQPAGETLMVLPEGVMLNYLARMPSPVAPVCFYSTATGNGREEQLVSELQRRAPDCVVILSRDLREYGIERYGERRGAGQELLRWVARNYQPAASVGEDPLDYTRRGGVLLQRRTGP